jgi:uncharacterized protein (DUF697 family)
MVSYEDIARHELRGWQIKMAKKPTVSNKLARQVQDKINDLIPERVHALITDAIRNMVKAVLTGSEFISDVPLAYGSLEDREDKIKEKVESYKKIAAASGFGIGSGGFLLALADLPVLLSIKMKMLFDIAGLYGYDVRSYQERLYILYVFQVAFSGKEKCTQCYQQLLTWEENRQHLPSQINEFDWRSFQQEYRDYIDLAKLLQLVPGIGAVVGAYANHQLVDKLGETAMNSYRMRFFYSKLLS